MAYIYKEELIYLLSVKAEKGLVPSTDEWMGQVGAYPEQHVVSR
jgi:hypothetical protein